MKKIFLLGLTILLASCGEPKIVNLNDKDEVANLKHTMSLEYRDWHNTANYMIKSMLKNKNFLRVKDPVIAISDIQNDTMQRFDTDILVKKIRSSLLHEGVQIATNFTGEDTTSNKVRNKRNNDEYDIKTIAKKNTLIAPNLSLSGKMIQRNLDIKTSIFDSRTTRTEYYLQLTLTDLRTGLSIWEDEKEILKEGKNPTTW